MLQMYQNLDRSQLLNRINTLEGEQVKLVFLVRGWHRFSSKRDYGVKLLLEKSTLLQEAIGLLESEIEKLKTWDCTYCEVKTKNAELEASLSAAEAKVRELEEKQAFDNRFFDAVYRYALGRKIEFEPDCLELLKALTPPAPAAPQEPDTGEGE